MPATDSHVGLFHFLRNLRAEKGKECTHTSIGRPAASYLVPGEQSHDFLTLYTQAISDGHNLHFTEKHRDVGPVVIDIDLRHELAHTPASAATTSSPTRMYTPQDLHDLLAVYMQVMDGIVVLPDDDNGVGGDPEEGVLIYVLEKPAPTIPEGRSYVKDGWHVMIPDVVTRPAVQYLMRREVLKDPAIPQIFERMHITNSINDAIDEAVICRNNWQMYGSRKPGQSAYALTRLFRYSSTTKTLCTVPCPRMATFAQLSQLISTLSIRNKPVETVAIQSTRLGEVDALEKAMRAKAAAAAAAAAAPAVCDNLLSRDDAFFTMQRNVCASEQEFRTVERLVDSLMPSRADSYNDWMRVGWCLRNIDWRLLPKWIDFSRRSTKFVEGECNAQWQKMRTPSGGLGMGTLHMWAKMDNPTEYRSILADSVRHLLLNSVSQTHYDISRVVYVMYHHEYVCSSIKHRSWYEFHNHRWRSSDCAYTLRQKISTEVFRAYENLAKECQETASTMSEDEGARWLDRSKKLRAIATKLKQCNFKDSLMKECSEMFYRERFEELLDSKCNLVGFENGVYDLDKAEFRPGHPDDMISFSTGIDYVPYNPQAPTMLEIHHFLDKVFTDASVRTYVLNVLASFLHGTIRNERFHIWTGSGSNGKSCCVDLFEKSFGDYCCKFPVALLTQKRVASNAATSELARAKGKRFACLQEPSEDEKLNIGYMKELTGGDKVFARLIYKEPIEFKPQFKMILTCNHLPHVPSDDGGTWRRIRVVEFTSRFVDNPDPSNRLEFQIDSGLTSRFQEWCPHFMALLLHTYHTIADGTYTEPDPVMQCTRDYQRDNDIFTEFFDAMFVKVDGQPPLDIEAVYEEFKYWLRQDNPNARLPRRKELQSFLHKKLHGTVTRRGGAGGLTRIPGYRLRTSEATQ